MEKAAGKRFLKSDGYFYRGMWEVDFTFVPSLEDIPDTAKEVYEMGREAVRKTTWEFPDG